MSKIWQSSRRKGSELLLLLAIADNANDSGYAYPGIEYLARKSRLSERQVRRIIQSLEESGELSVDRNHKNNRYQINLYALTIPDIMSYDFDDEDVQGAMPDISGTIEDIQGTIEDIDVPLTVLNAFNHYEPKEGSLKLWELIRNQLKSEMAKVSFDQFVLPVVPVSLDGDRLVLACSDDYNRQWLEDRTKTTVRNIARGCTNREISIDFVVLEKEI